MQAQLNPTLCFSKDISKPSMTMHVDANRGNAKAMLMAQFGIESAFVRIPTMAKILGIAAPTIYASIRTGRFFLPHRMLNSVPVIKLDDLVEWYCIENQTALRDVATHSASSDLGRKNGPLEEDDAKVSSSKERLNKIVGQVLESMGLEGDSILPRKRRMP